MPLFPTDYVCTQFQAVRIQTKKIFGAKNPPLNYVDEFVKVDHLVS
jgi:hypothetical protein